MRVKAKAFVQGTTRDTVSEQKSKSIDPNNFTCKFCNGTVEIKSNKFMHEKQCIMFTQTKTEPEAKADPKAKKSKKAPKLSENSTLNSSMHTQGEMLDEDRAIEEFARKMEIISKQPPLRFVNTGRRKRRLKPNVSKDWLNNLRKQIQLQSGEKDCAPIDSNDSESLGAMSLNSGTNSLDAKKTKLKDMTAEHIQVKDARKKAKK